MRPRDPLAALERLRRQRVEAGRQDLAVKGRELAEARQARERAESALLYEQTRQQAVLQSEGERLRRPGARAIDLARCDEFVHAARSHEAVLQRSVERARTDEQRALAAAQRARAELATAEGEARALERHRHEKQQALERAQENRSDDVAMDLYGNLRHGGRV